MQQIHSIGKLEMSHQLPAGEFAPAVREATARICHEQLLPALSELLDTWTVAEETLSIERIEIALHMKDVHQMEQLLVQEIISKIRSLYNPASGITGQRLSVKKTPRARSNFNSWVYFLKHGTLPHTTRLPEQAVWEQDILETLATQPSAKDACRDVLRNYPLSMTRMLSQFGENFIRQWAAAHAGPASSQITTLVQQWEAVFERQDFQQLIYQIPVSAPAFQNRSRRWLIYKIVVQAGAQDPGILLEDLGSCCFDKTQLPRYFATLEKYLDTGQKDWPVLTGALAAWKIKNPAPPSPHPNQRIENPGTGSRNQASPSEETTIGSTEETTIGSTDALSPASGDDAPGNEKAIDSYKTGDNSTDLISGRAPVANRDKTQSPDATPPEMEASVKGIAENEKDIQPDETAIYQEGLTGNTGEDEQPREPGSQLHYIADAGLVLLHPYLHNLFSSQGLIEKNKFKSPFSRNKAVQFLCYLANGETGLPEYELVLPKLLCGLSPATPVNRFVQISEEEKEEANTLLKAVVGHWKVLGNTSPDGLRANFLRREGRLQWKTNEWRLRVTQLTHDILLDRLPWSISIIRLPWMKFFLKTEWV